MLTKTISLRDFTVINLNSPVSGHRAILLIIGVEIIHFVKNNNCFKRPFGCQAVSQLHHRTIILFAISAKSQKLFVNRYNQAFFTNSCQKPAISLWYYDYYAIYQLPSLAIKPVTPTILIILAILKQLDKIEASALTPSKPRNKKPVTFKLCFKWPNGSSTFCLRSL